MNYSSVLEKIHALNKFGSRPGLERMGMLLEKMGNPQKSLKCVHIAGTNGKGSVSAVTSSVLRASGYKTGLFISPYITDFCERIQINNQPISHADLCNTAQYVFSFVDELNAEGVIITEFEFVTAVAFEYFKRERCDIAVLEVGLGGRLDSTNLIDAPLCAVLTRIGLDHTDILGDTIEKIAKEKCGIIKKGAAVVSSPQHSEARAVLENTCKELSNSLVFSDELALSVLRSDISGSGFEYKGKEITLPLLGEHQVENLKTALCALEKLREAGFENITPESIKEGVESSTNPARFEVLCKTPYVIIDGAHNPDGMSTFSKAVKKFFPHQKGVLIMGMLRDKDSVSALEYIGDLFCEVYTVPVDNPRAMTSAEMGALCEKYFQKVSVCNSVTDAFDRAFDVAKNQGVHLCVCGSLYLAGQIRPYILECVNKI